MKIYTCEILDHEVKATIVGGAPVSSIVVTLPLEEVGDAYRDFSNAILEAARRKLDAARRASAVE